MALDEIKNEETVSSNFIHDFIDEDLAEGVYSRVQTRFPPEPNGYLHIGHAKAICINFGVKNKYNGICNLRLDDTNPTKEDTEYVESIEEDIKWLGFDYDNVYYASDYFDFLYECAIKLIKKGKAFVCDLTPEQQREYRGTLTEPGKNSPYRDRSIEENLDLFERMTKGEFEAGSKVLRAKIDMASPNLNMRDPIIYRIMYATHHRTGDKWCVYPMYDFAHPLSDACEKVTHSLCSLEFENHRPLYNWFVNECIEGEKPRQIEFARMNLNYTLTSKRKCLKLVQDGIVDKQILASLEAMIGPGNFKADTIIVDGYNFQKATKADLDLLKDFAKKMNVEIWISASLKADDVIFDANDFPVELTKFKDDVDIIISLRFKNDVIQMKVVKDEGGDVTDDIKLMLDAKTLLIAEK